jgi:hypothetical protein
VIGFTNTQTVKRFIQPNSKIYAYPDMQGIPGYPVFWDYRYIIFSESGQALFTYGACSD